PHPRARASAMWGRSLWHAAPPLHRLGRVARPRPRGDGVRGRARVSLCCCWDEAFRPLRDQFVASVRDTDVEMREAYVEDIGAKPHRAAGGPAVYVFKLRHLLESLEAAEPGSFVIFSDVDVQFFTAVLPDVQEAMAGLDACFQRECHDVGVNIGFMAVRRTGPSLAFWQRVLELVEDRGGLDQRVVNDLLYTGYASTLGMPWGRLPPRFWASSQALSGPPPQRLAVHHANWVTRAGPTWAAAEAGGASGSSDPRPKLAQLAALRAAVEAGAAGSEASARLAAALAEDGALERYQRRYFGDARCGPEWASLPLGHPCAPGEPQVQVEAARPSHGRRDLRRPQRGNMYMVLLLILLPA
ncbi:unnamed protein product, partial [Prorocentrum cordatum]